MVVLCSDVEPAHGLAELAQTVGVELSDSGYIAVTGEDGAGVASSHPGIFVAGCASGPKNIKDSIATARAAADGALENLDRRLLGPDYVPQKTEEVTEPGVAPVPARPEPSEDETRARIEQLLHALLSKADA